jgi:putative Ca2+/H+ antiporter (TMEM165/GDT1 family)
MEWKVFATVFVTVFFAELGDKTQLATMMFASDRAVSPWLIFAGASVALILASGLGVLGGQILTQVASEKTLKLIAGVAFILVGAWTLIRG